jgi:hypothetical protein
VRRWREREAAAPRRAAFVQLAHSRGPESLAHSMGMEVEPHRLGAPTAPLQTRPGVAADMNETGYHGRRSARSLVRDYVLANALFGLALLVYVLCVWRRRRIEPLNGGLPAST